MRLSIIIVNWNTAKLLRQCLDSLVSSINPPAGGQVLSIEIIVVDNGSTDNSVEEVKKFIVHSSLFNIQLIENQANLGFAKAVNQALRQVYTERNRSAQGEVFLLLNSDAQIKPGSLEKLLEFEEQVRPAVIGGRMLNPDGSVQPSCFFFPTVKRALLEYWLGRKGYFSKYAPEGKEPKEVEAVSGGAMLISGEIIKKVGLLDERYFMYFEDLDYCRRVRKAGYKVFYLPQAEIIHEHGASGQHLIGQLDQWKRLVPSSKVYYGFFKHYLISFILWVGQKWQKK